MRGRKLLCLALCLALTLSLAVPALAADDEELLNVTAKVKETLGLDTEEFADFHGYAEEDVLLGKRWNLEWNSDGASLSVTADDAGKVYSLNRYTYADANTVAYSGGKLNIPKLPEDKSGAAFAVAKDFLSKVLESGVESIDLANTAAPTLQQSSYRFSGNVLLNGLASPITCSVTVRASDLAVTRFYRSDQYAGYLGGVPDATTTRTEDQARHQLRSTINMKAQFVLEPNSKTATVRYVPLSGDGYYVDAKSGKLVNLTELFQKLWANERGGAGADKLMNTMTQEMADAESPAAGLTQAERDGAAILAGALSKEDLDLALKNAWPEIGLKNYTLSAARYSVSERPIEDGAERTAEDYTVTCRLTYAKEQGQTIRYKYVTVEAKTGQLKNLYSSRVYRGEGKEEYAVNYGFSTAQTTAEAALKIFAGRHADVVALADSTNARAEFGWEYLYSYQHKAGDWFYPDNYYTIGVDATDGTLSRLEGSFDDDVVLQVPQKIVTVDQAVDAYLAAMAVPHGYVEVPVSISMAGNDVMPLLKEAGYSYVMSLKNGYTLTQPESGYVEGVYAESGQAIVTARGSGERTELTYDDLDDHWVKTAAEALATFGIGLRGGSLAPNESLTQLDMVALLLSVDGYIYDPTAATAEETDFLYRYAYSLGIVDPKDRKEDKVVTRGELVKLILDAAGYERVAALAGIFRCDFADAASLDSATVGYAALAQGLGLVKGGSDGAYAPGRESTRAEAIAMLYQYMK